MRQRVETHARLEALNNLTVTRMSERFGSSVSRSKESKRMSMVAPEVPHVNGTTTHTENNMIHAASLPTLSCNNCLSHRQEVEKLKVKYTNLKKDFSTVKKALEVSRKQEANLRERLAHEARDKLQHSDKFEDLSSTDRPTALINQYGSLYSQSRLDAMDGLDSLAQLDGLDNLKTKLLFSIVVLSFRQSQHRAERLREKVSQTLGIPKDKTSLPKEQKGVIESLENNVSLYLRQSVSWIDLKTLNEEVHKSIVNTLHDYPCLTSCSKLRVYIEDCVKIAWKLSVQNPPCKLEFDCRQFSDNKQQRFHSSNGESDYIKSYVWPSLVDAKTNACLHKAVVIT